MTYKNRPVGHLLSRREIVLMLGGSAVWLMAGSLIPQAGSIRYAWTLMCGPDRNKQKVRISSMSA